MATATAAPKAEKAPKTKGIIRMPYERRKAIYGYCFIAIWIIGAIWFFLVPLINTFWYSFNDASPETGNMKTDWVGMDNYIKAFTNDLMYSQKLVSVLGDTLLKTPLIMIFSIFVSVILNQKFHGRVFARAVFFLPVIIATGPVIEVINGNMDTGGYTGGSEQFSSLFETDLVDQLLEFLGIYGISDTLTETISTVTSDIFNLVWNSGIQILIFLAALQNIPVSAKEAASMEGATAWEFFWKITIPYISPMILAALVYTVVDSFVDPSNEVMNYILQQQSTWQYGYMSAMAWVYFAIVGVALGIVSAIISKFVYYEV